LSVQLMQPGVRDALHRGVGAYGHEHGCGEVSVRSRVTRSARCTRRGFYAAIE
jgi:hypothetical protein